MGISSLICGKYNCRIWKPLTLFARLVLQPQARLHSSQLEGWLSPLDTLPWWLPLQGRQRRRDRLQPILFKAGGVERPAATPARHSKPPGRSTTAYAVAPAKHSAPLQAAPSPQHSTLTGRSTAAAPSFGSMRPPPRAVGPWRGTMALPRSMPVQAAAHMWGIAPAEMGTRRRHHPEGHSGVSLLREREAGAHTTSLPGRGLSNPWAQGA